MQIIFIEVIGIVFYIWIISKIVIAIKRSKARKLHMMDLKETEIELLREQNRILREQNNNNNNSTS